MDGSWNWLDVAGWLAFWLWVLFGDRPRVRRLTRHRTRPPQNRLGRSCTVCGALIDDYESGYPATLGLACWGCHRRMQQTCRVTPYG